MIRSAKESDCFPYRSSVVCYIELRDGQIDKIASKNQSDLWNVLDAAKRAEEGKSVLYAVWPGKWSSDLFIIDDLPGLR